MEISLLLDFFQKTVLGLFTNYVLILKTISVEKH